MKPGMHGLVKVVPVDETAWTAMEPHGEWVATTRFNDPVKGVTQIRRYGATEAEARDAVLVVCAERAKRSVPKPPDFETFGEAMDWWWSHVRPSLDWSPATERNYAFARQHLDRVLERRLLPAPADDVAMLLEDELHLPQGRTRTIVMRLLEQVQRLPGVND